MLFNSFEFILFFLPITLIVYFLLNKQRLVVASKAWLVFASLFFYSWWNIKYLPLILCSIIFNFSIGIILRKDNANKYKLLSNKNILIFAIICNLLLLGFYKYSDFFISNVNNLADFDFSLLHIILPLGISFFTFTQIAYLVDAYKGKVKDTNYLNYSLFVTFFPHLIAGPILHHSEIMPQFDDIKRKIIDNKNLILGLSLFSIGLFKKVVIADTLSVSVNDGYNATANLNMFAAWTLSLSYTFQLYYDFSGYTDMALGMSKMFNINLPINFNSPYKATSIQDFWRRWHITLTRFLRDYIYIPLGGNRKGELKTCINLVVTFLLGGLWHGAGWGFIIWGLLHGFALVVNRLWRKLGIKMNSYVAWFITFNFVNIAWVFFRAPNMCDTFNVIKAMFGFNGDAFTNILGRKIALITFGLLLLTLILQNSMQIINDYKPKWNNAVLIAIIFVLAVCSLNKISEFLYFQF